jgi:penicillin-binding protein 2
MEKPEQHYFKDENVQLVRSGMRRAALMGGTAETMSSLRVSVACKTGTAEVWNGEPHSWFVGYFPAKEPQVSVVVFIENGGASSTGSVPAAKRLIAQIADILDM